MNLPVERKSVLLGIAMGALTLVLFLALVTDGYQVRDQVTRPFDEMLSVPNLLGAPGALVAFIFSSLVGDARHVTYSLTFIWTLMLLSRHPLDRLLPRMLGAGLVLVAVAGFLQLNFRAGTSNIYPGGVVGTFVVDMLNAYGFGYAGSNVIVFSLILVGLLLATEYMFLYLYVVLRHGGALLLRGVALYREARAVARATGSDTEDPAPAKSRRPGRVPRQVAMPLAEAFQDVAVDDAPPPELDFQLPEIDRHARINVRIAPEVPVVVEDEAPFDAVPEITGEDFEEEEEAFSGTSLAFDLDPLDDGSGEAEAEKMFEEEEEFEEEAEGLDSDEAPFDQAEDEYEDEVVEEDVYEEEPVVVTPPARPAAVARAAEAPKVRRPRRKVDAHEELPPGYEYPRHYTRPPMDLLDEPEERVVVNLAETLRSTSVLLEDTLQTFGIEAKVTDVTRGPTITRFELEPAPGIKVARFLALADDIALALKAHRIRVEAPIPGKGRVGIEAPNAERDQVLIRELLESQPFKRGKGKLNLVLGKDIAGDVKIADLAAMPHLLVAGATGAGKTVCVKAILASLLFKHSPDDLQLILIDPKMVELSIFNDIPHLITPVVIDPKKASIALTWLINEMEERYRLFADLRVRNIEIYNQSVENGEIELDGDEDDDAQSLHIVRRLPYIVCVIDELADLMMLARSEVEDCIARLAQLARAVGIHLIIATQRPSVDVLTGVIKANFPSRISFQVSSRVDSRCILDEIGAERLIGMGDMLYLPAGQSKPTRIQGAFVSDEEMNGLINYLKRQAPPQYKDEIENFGKSKDKLDDIADEPDDLFEEAVQVVMDTGQASISMVQRRLRVGYTRAARLIDMMERKGIVGPHTGSKAREILVDAVHIEESS